MGELLDDVDVLLVAPGLDAGAHRAFPEAMSSASKLSAELLQENTPTRR